MNTDNNYDLTIVGAGIIGLWVARLALKYNPHHRILMLDQSLIGHGATQYSLGLNYVYGDTSQKKELSLKSSVLWEELFQDEPQLFSEKRSLYVLLDQGHQELLQSRFSKDDFFHLPASVMESFKDNHHWFEKNEKTTVFYSESYQIPSDIAVSLACALKQEYLFDLYEGMKLVDLSYNNDEIQLKTASNDIFRSQKLILALGPWVNSFLSDHSVLSEIKTRYTKKIVSLHFDQAVSETDPILFWPEAPAFLVPNASTQQWVLSIKSETKDCQPDIQQLNINEQDKAKGFAFLKKYAPGLKESFRGGRVFCDVYEDNQAAPYPTLLKNFPHSVIVGAGSGIGFRLAPGIAFEALQAIDYLS